MITTFFSDTDPDDFTGALSMIEANVINTPSTSECLQSIICTSKVPYTERAYALIGGLDYQNDKNDFLFQLSLPVDTVVIKIFKNGEELATIVDNTYGTLFPTTFFTSGLKIGFIAEWEKIINESGAGIYHFEFNQTIAGNNNVTRTHDYKLEQFDPDQADGTIVIKTLHQGYIKNGIDYADVPGGWEGRVRFRGSFGRPKFPLTTEDYQTLKSQLRQLQDNVRILYELQIELIPSKIILPFLLDRILATEIEILDYGIFRFLDNCDFRSVRPDSIEDPEYFGGNKDGVFKFIFKDTDQATLKRNF